MSPHLPRGCGCPCSAPGAVPAAAPVRQGTTPARPRPADAVHVLACTLRAPPHHPAAPQAVATAPACEEGRAAADRASTRRPGEAQYVRPWLYARAPRTAPRTGLVRRRRGARCGMSPHRRVPSTASRATPARHAPRSRPRLRLATCRRTGRAIRRAGTTGGGVPGIRTGLWRTERLLCSSAHSPSSRRISGN